MKEINETLCRSAVRKNSEDTQNNGAWTCLHFVLGHPAVCVLSNDCSLGGNRSLGDVETLINKGSLSTSRTLRAAIMSKQCL